MNLGFISAAGRGATNPILARVAQRLLARGFRVQGTVQSNAERPDGAPCDMDVRVLPDGPRIRISQARGRLARGCRLDADGLERAVALVHAELSAQTDLLIVNKFGKLEAEGRGFRDLIADAVALDVPVLVGVNAINRPAFDAFSFAMAEALPPHVETLVAWAVRARDATQPPKAPIRQDHSAQSPAPTG